MDKPTTEREPLLEVCREAARQVCRDQWCEGGSQLTLAMDVADGIAKVIQAKITSGELVVRHKCKKCGNLWTPSFITKSRCPGCGNPIT
jgi:predicted Zn-ribbon and HTH transcriptional regulator